MNCKKAKKYWSKEEEQILKQLYGILYVRDIAKILNRSESSIYNKAKQLKLKSGLRGNVPKALSEIIRKNNNNHS